MKPRKILCILFCCLLLVGLSPTVRAANMTAQIATGPTTLNSVKIDNSTAKYPMLVFNDITYFPMTYHLCRFLGLTSNWESQKLSIAKSGERNPYVAEIGSGNRRGNVPVSRVNYQVYVNGTLVDNKNSKWPLLSYNNITYFPLTWEFAVEAFGWDYTWDVANGLVINSSNAESVSSPTEPVVGNTGQIESADISTVLAALDKFYGQGHTYNGTLSDPQTGISNNFTAISEVNQSGGHFLVTLTAEPFVFLENGYSVDALYFDGDLTGNPQFGSSVKTEEREQAETVFSSFEKSELGYLAQCFLDCQFSGERTAKILSSNSSIQGSTIVWNLQVLFESENFHQYNAAVTIEDNLVKAIQITSDHYTVSMQVVS